MSDINDRHLHREIIKETIDNLIKSIPNDVINDLYREEKNKLEKEKEYSRKMYFYYKELKDSNKLSDKQKIKYIRYMKAFSDYNSKKFNFQIFLKIDLRCLIANKLLKTNYAKFFDGFIDADIKHILNISSSKQMNRIKQQGYFKFLSIAEKELNIDIEDFEDYFKDINDYTQKGYQ